MRRLKGIIELLVALALIGLVVWTNIVPDEGRRLEDSIYVDDAVVLPENEGKRVIIAGRVDATGQATDPDLNITFDSPSVRRSVDRLHHIDEWQWSSVSEGATDADLTGGTFADTATLGQFTLSPELVKRLPAGERDWDEDDLDQETYARLEQSWDFAIYDGQLYLTQAPLVIDPEWDYLQNRGLEGLQRVRYRVWNSDSIEVTVVGIQHGSTLDYDPDLNAGSAFSGIQTADELVESNNRAVLIGEIIFAGIPALLLIVLGVRNVLDL